VLLVYSNLEFLHRLELRAELRRGSRKGFSVGETTDTLIPCVDNGGECFEDSRTNKREGFVTANKR